MQESKAEYSGRLSLRALTSQNIRLARKNWPVDPEVIPELKNLTREFHLSVALGDVRLLDGRWYVTHGGLMHLARRSRCVGIHSQLMREFCDPTSRRWVFKAIVYRSALSKGFVGYGDADPSNVSPLVRGAEMRVAETRAVNRALRKAYGIGLCSIEEVGSMAALSHAPRDNRGPSIHANENGSGHSAPRLRDRLCLLIRQFNLDPTLVKAFAADFCGTETLKDASRDLVESFIAYIARAAKEDRDGLICKLNSFAQPTEVKS